MKHVQFVINFTMPLVKVIFVFKHYPVAVDITDNILDNMTRHF
jgi:hypothetical protein